MNRNMRSDLDIIDESSLLAFDYHLKKALYSLPFRERIWYHLGIPEINCSFKNMERMSRAELINATKNLKKPWWNWMFFLWS